jgi:acetolactate synthase-1/2/3 large subunit
MNGAESLVHTLLECGVDTCFANPGTSEMHFVAALDRIPGMRCVLGLFEGVVTGAADGYARMAGKPAATLLHCGPGLANGLANLHNGKRGRTMMVNCVGDQATYHRPLDPPLAADTEGWARGVSGFVRTAKDAADVGGAAAAAVAAAQTSPGHIATLILPSDTCWRDGGIVAEKRPVPPAPRATKETIAEMARLLRNEKDVVLLLGGNALRQQAVADAHAIAAATGCRVLAENFCQRIERGAGRFSVTRVPYSIDHALEVYAGAKHVVRVGAVHPVIFFAYPGKPQTPVPKEARQHVLSLPEGDQPHDLAALAAELGAKSVSPPKTERPKPASGAVASAPIAQSLAALLPDDAIVVDESITFGRAFYPALATAATHDFLQVTGGAIGGGMPLATGAAIYAQISASGRRVINLEADGSAMYTIQSLWTQAREKLDITTVIFSNRKYAILLGEYSAVGANPGRTALDMLDLGNPDLDFVKIAAGMGVEGARATSVDEFNDLFAMANRRKGPFLIDLAC